jgi:hypothetical protein
MHGWLSAADAPVKADAIVVLSGDYRRTRQAAELYRQKLADYVILTRTQRPATLRMLDADGIYYPQDEEVSRQVLEKHGVPPKAIVMVGTDLISTAGEALALQAYFQAASTDGSRKRLLVITSPYHILRARIVLRRALPGLDVSVEDYVDCFKPTLMDVVYRWSNGCEFSELLKVCDLFEGTIIRSVRRLDELLGQLAVAAAAVGDLGLKAKFEAAALSLRHGIMFSNSLYL